MKLVNTPLNIILTLTGTPTTNEKLLFPKGLLSDDGQNAQWCCVEVIDTGKLKLHRIQDVKSNIKYSNSKNFNVKFDFIVENPSTFSYCSRLTNNVRIANIFQQTSTNIWAFIEFNFSDGTKTKQINLNCTGDNSYIDYFSRFDKHVYYRVFENGTDEKLYYFNIDDVGAEGIVTSPIITDLINDKNQFCCDNNYLYLLTEVTGNAVLQIYDVGTNNIVNTINNPFADRTVDYDCALFRIATNNLYLRKKGTELFEIKDNVSTLLNNDMIDDTVPYFRIQNNGTKYVEASEITITPYLSDSHNDNWYIPSTQIVKQINLAHVIAFLLLSNGYEYDEYDVYDLSETFIDGAEVTRYTELKYLDIIEQLSSVYQFDYYRNSCRLEFRKRGHSVDTIIDYRKMGMITANDNISNQVFEENIIRENKIPKELTIEYVNKSADYQDATEVINFYDVGEQNNNYTIDFKNIVFDPNKAKQSVDIMLMTLTDEVKTYMTWLSIYYFYLLPASIIQFTYEGYTYTWKINNVNYSFPLSYQIQGVNYNKNNYFSLLQGSSSQTSEGIELPALVNFDLFNIPLLKNGDNVHGFYWAYILLSGAPEGVKLWQKEGIWLGIDTTLAMLGFGSVQGILLDKSINYIDYESTLDIQSNVVLSNLTDEQFYSRLYNKILINGEIVIFKDVIDNGGNNYTVSTFLRGLHATDKFVDIHENNETMYLLDNFKSYESVGLISEKLYIAQDTAETSVNNEENVQLFTSTSERLKPYSPIILHVTNDGDDIVIFVDVQNRDANGDHSYWNVFNDNNLDGTNFEVDVLNLFGDVVRTLTSNNKMITYMGTEQVNDFGEVIETISFNVYQMSSSVGRGYANSFYDYVGVI